MIEKLKKEVLQANKELSTSGLVILTWGNASGFDPDSGLVVIKGSGIEYGTMTEDDLAVVDLNGKTIGGAITPSTDLATHLELYRHFPAIRGVIHTHSCYATIWAQAGRDIPCFGTTHADYFKGSIPCTRKMRSDEIQTEYELNSGKVILERFADLDYTEMKAVLINKHGPIVWGNSPIDALHNSIVLETVAKMAYCTAILDGQTPEILDSYMIDKHYNRKFGLDAYYGQHDEGK